MTSQVRKRKTSPQVKDDSPKQQKSSHEQKINPLLILLLVCVILTWGVAATLVFNLVDYKGMAEWASKMVNSEPKTVNPESSPNVEEVLKPIQNESVENYRIDIKDIQVTRDVINVELDGKLESDLRLGIRRKRKSNLGTVQKWAIFSNKGESKVAIPFHAYAGYDYEIVDTKLIVQFTFKPSAEDLVETFWTDEDDEDIIKKAKKLISDGKKFDSSEKKIDDVYKLAEKAPEFGYIKLLGAKATDDLAEKKRSNKILLDAIKKFGAICDEEKFLVSVRNAACERALERSQFLGRNTLAFGFAQKLVTINPHRNYEYLKKLGVAYLMLGRNEEAEATFKRILDIDEFDGWANVHMGFAVKAQDRYNDCLLYFERGVASEEPGTEESKYRYHWGDALVRLGRKIEANNMFEAASQAGIFLSKFQRSTYNVNHLKGQPYWTPDELGLTVQNYIRKLEIEWKTIRDEGLALMDENQNFPNFDKEAEGLQKQGDWRQFNLWQRGMEEEANCKLVPKTCHMIRAMTEATGCRRGQIKYSVMQPGTVVWPHTGPTNARLRLHLGLVVPEDYKNVNLTVAEQTRYWQEGKVLTFDDSFEHSVLHHGEHYRLVLIMDVWHPELTKKEKSALTSI